MDCASACESTDFIDDGGESVDKNIKSRKVSGLVARHGAIEACVSTCGGF